MRGVGDRHVELRLVEDVLEGANLARGESRRVGIRDIGGDGGLADRQPTRLLRGDVEQMYRGHRLYSGIGPWASSKSAILPEAVHRRAPRG